MVSGTTGGGSGTEAFLDRLGFALRSSSSNSSYRFEFGVLGSTAVGGSWLSKASAFRVSSSSVKRVMGRLAGEVGRQRKAALLQGGVGERERQCSRGGRGDDPALEVVRA